MHVELAENYSYSAEEIMDKLKYFTKPFPEKLVLAAIEKQEEITPLLINSLQYAFDNYQDIGEDEMGHIYALFLLSQFREKRAYSLFLKILSLPEENAELLFGDIIFDDSTKIIVSTYDGNIEPLLELMLNKEINSYIRIAIISAVVALFFHDFISREETLAHLESAMDSFEGDDDDFTLWGAMASACLDMGAEEHAERINKAFDDDLVDEMWISKEEFAKISKDTPEYRLERNAVITDICKTMEWWSCFREDDYSFLKSLRKDEPVVVPVRTTPKIGRNKPCPCGSSKKYKKCCM